MSLEATPRKDPDDQFPRLGIEFQQVVSDDIPDDSPARVAGIKASDQLLDVAPVGSAVGAGRSVHEMDELIQLHAGQPLQVVVLRREFDQDGRPIEKPAEKKTFTVTPKGNPIYDIGITWSDIARVEFVQNNSPAKALLEENDILVSIDGVPITAKNLPDAVKQAGDKHRRGKGEKSAPVKVKFQRRNADGVWQDRESEVQLDPKPNDDGWFLGVKYLTDKVGIKPGYFVTGVSTDKLLWVKPKNRQRGKDDQVKLACALKKDQPWTIYFETPDGKTKDSKDIAAVNTGRVEGDLGIKLMPRPIKIRRGIVDACVLGWDRTGRMFQQLVLTLRGLVTRNVSSKELGGPIQIATITYKIASSNGVGKLFYFLAILSVNLAVLNILPIPVLDGGHIFLLTVEKLKGRPLSDDVMRYVQYAGLLFVVGLMLYVTFNDIRRVFE
jgi:membrane-associated protease RseP (regulator of RpoE activity)